ncbi:MAG: glycosyltransferase [Acidobacteria bacterium]|nr:MAG: glycosyltransferase [Acidobacteriota bacterium]
MWPDAPDHSTSIMSIAAAPHQERTLPSRPRILHLVTTLNKGGTEALVLTLAREQRRQGCAVEIAVLTRPGAAAADFAAAGFRIQALGLRHKLSPGAWWRLRRLLQAGDYDILHTHLDLSDLYGPFALTSGRPLVVSTRHNTDPWRTRRSWKRRPFLIWERAAHRRTAVTLAVSGAVRDFLVREEGLDPERFAVVPNGIDLAPFVALPSRAVARADLVRRLRRAGCDGQPGGDGGERPVTLFAGRLEPQKGADILLAAHALLATDMDLVICGRGADEVKLRHQVATLKPRGRVFFAGYQENLAAILPAFDLYVMPSRWEGFGLGAAEAMAAGLPVVASDCDGLREVVADGSTGLLAPPGDIRALARAMERVLQDGERAVAWGRAGRRRAFDVFSSRRMATDVLEQYRRALDGTRNPGGQDLDTLILADRQVRGMWRGILPGNLMRRPPGWHLANQARDYAHVIRQVESVTLLQGRRLLDIGCGLGTLLLEAGRHGASALGIEPDPRSLVLSRHRLAREGGPAVGVVAAVGESLPLADASCDVVTCCSVLEHVEDPRAVLAEVARVLKPGGWLYLGVPNALNFQERHYKVFMPPRTPRFLARLYLRLRGRDPAFLGTLHEMTPGRARALVQAAGLKIVIDPTRRRLERIEDVLQGRRRPGTLWRQLTARLARGLGGGGLLRALVRRGFFVDGALLARRPEDLGS